jgi:hypothetical protein
MVFDGRTTLRELRSPPEVGGLQTTSTRIRSVHLAEALDSWEATTQVLARAVIRDGAATRSDGSDGMPGASVANC